MLGPLLFVLYINDLPDGKISEVFMIADENKVYRKVTEEADISTLQSDIGKLQSWSNQHLLRFHPDNCSVLTVSRQIEHELRTYTMKKKVGEAGKKNSVLRTLEREKDITVTVDRSYNLSSR